MRALDVKSEREKLRARGYSESDIDFMINDFLNGSDEDNEEAVELIQGDLKVLEKEFKKAQETGKPVNGHSAAYIQARITEIKALLS